MLHHLIATVEKLPLTAMGCPLHISCKNFHVAHFVISSERDCQNVHQSLVRLSQPGTYNSIPDQPSSLSGKNKIMIHWIFIQFVLTVTLDIFYRESGRIVCFSLQPKTRWRWEKKWLGLYWLSHGFQKNGIAQWVLGNDGPQQELWGKLSNHMPFRLFIGFVFLSNKCCLASPMQFFSFALAFSSSKGICN